MLKPPAGTLCFWCGGLATHKCAACGHYICSKPGCITQSGKAVAVNRIVNPVTAMLRKLGGQGNG